MPQVCYMFTVPLFCKVIMLTHSSEFAVWKHQMIFFFSLSTPDVCLSLGTKRCCVWHFSFHGDWNTAGWKTPPTFCPLCALPPSLPRSHLWSADLLSTRGVNMVISAFIGLEADQLQLSLNILIFWGRQQLPCQNVCLHFYLWNEKNNY